MTGRGEKRESQGLTKVKKQGLNNSQGLTEVKNQGWTKVKN